VRAGVEDANQDDQLMVKAYRVGVGDVLLVQAYQHEEISGDFLVEEDGSISYPLLGRVPVMGKTITAISKTLEQALEKDYFVDVQLHLEVKEYRSQPVTLLGEIGKAGTYYLHGRTMLTQMLAEAGGLRPSAGPALELRRIEFVNGQEQQRVITFATKDLLSGSAGGDVELRAGDILSIPAMQLYFITGEVSRPGEYEIARGMTLMQAISKAGGVGKFASQSVELHRGEGEEKQILDFDLGRIRKGKDTDVEIRAGDVIIVKKRFF